MVPCRDPQSSASQGCLSWLGTGPKREVSVSPDGTRAVSAAIQRHYPRVGGARCCLTSSWFTVIWNQGAFQCPWPGHNLTAADEIKQGACGDLTPFPWACWGERFEVYCLSRFLRLPRVLIVIWFEFFYTHGSGPSVDIPTSNPGVLFQPDLELTVESILLFLECSFRSLLACLQSDQGLSSLPLLDRHRDPCPKASMWTWTCCGGPAMSTFPQRDLEETTAILSFWLTVRGWCFNSDWSRGREKL